MKKSILIITLCMGLAACSSNSNTNSADSSATKQDGAAQSAGTDTAAKSTPAASKGEALMATTDCSTCHRPDMKLVGPSFKEIAQKYTEADVDKLTAKVIKGGSGSWGDVAMTAHPTLKEDDVKEMVKYILSQK